MSDSKIVQHEPNPPTQINQNFLGGSLLSQVSAAAIQQAAPNQGDGPASNAMNSQRSKLSRHSQQSK